MIANKMVALALKEDIGDGDVSADLLLERCVNAAIICRQDCIICGFEYAEMSFWQLDESIKIDWQVREGDEVASNQVICRLTGSVKSILTAERTALNFLQTLSSTATETRRLVNKIADTKTKLLDTRKTIPCLRLAQKQAVQIGGGVNHRMGLYDAVMIKENHILALGSISKAVAKASEKHPNLALIVEVENLSQLAEALSLDGISRILCDNFSAENLKAAVLLANHKTPLEASGNIDENNIVDYAKTGVDYISIGAISKNICAIDLTLKIVGDEVI